ncbi:MAG TPA: hypothetical protein VJK52_01690 [Candidatus Nanoarchaeia archaeon]|nr:hypothetical protein [Candidatus Nanoarchaeia archaeon]
MADENLFFMRVDEPVEVRKQILESARISLYSLQRYERFKTVRAQKSAHMMKLRGKIKELNQVFVQLRGMLPDAAPVAEKEVRAEKRKELPVTNTDKAVEKLHHQLKAIEHKLNSLA